MGIRFNIPRPLPRITITPTPPKVPVFQAYTGSWKRGLPNTTVSADGWTVTRSNSVVVPWDTPVTSGKIYLEITCTNLTPSYPTMLPMIGWTNATNDPFYGGNAKNCVTYYSNYIALAKNTTSPGDQVVKNLPGMRTGDTMMVARDISKSMFWWGINGIWFNGATTADVSNGLKPTVTETQSMPYLAVDCGYANQQSLIYDINQGQKAYKYAKPTGFTPLGVPKI